MIRLIESARENAAIRRSDHAMCARIDALLQTYCGQSGAAGFYIQQSEGEQTALVASVDKAVTVFCLETADFEELRSFLSFRGFRSILCETRYCQSLGIEPDKTGPLLKRHAAAAPMPAAAAGRQAGKFELDGVFGVLAAAGLADEREKGPWLADAAARLNSAAAEAFAVFECGTAVSCAMILHQSARAAVIGAVATRPEYRGRGYAKALVCMASQKAARSGRSVYLLCENAAMQKFYGGCGFEPCGSWASAERSGN